MLEFGNIEEATEVVAQDATIEIVNAQEVVLNGVKVDMDSIADPELQAEIQSTYDTDLEKYQSSLDSTIELGDKAITDINVRLASADKIMEVVQPNWFERLFGAVDKFEVRNLTEQEVIAKEYELQFGEDYKVYTDFSGGQTTVMLNPKPLEVDEDLLKEVVK